MGIVEQFYRDSLGLFTDLYELTMAQGYWKLGRADDEAVFHLEYRSNPFGGGYAVACGLDYLVDYLQGLHFGATDLEYLATLKGNDDKALFDPGFLKYLGGLVWACDVDAVPEGTVVFAHTPLVRVQGPLLAAQIVESAVLNMVNFQTLIATKAARLCTAAMGDPVIEFGMRRAQGIDGAMSASRAAYVGGCAGTSNVLAGKLLGIPVKGTHAHSWVMCFDDELSSFEAYADALPNNCIFLVDTYDTLDGVRHAIAVGKKLRARGHKLAGVRLDSGDLAYLSKEARRMLDEAGFDDAVILASNELDEHVIASLKDQGATIAAWGVGTKLATAHDQPALGGVYKLSAIRRAGGDWEYKVKLSEQTAKVSTPGVLQVRRYRQNGRFIGDMVYNAREPLPARPVIVHPEDPTKRKPIPGDASGEDLLVPVFRAGRCVYALPGLEASRERVRAQLGGLHDGVKRFLNPHSYPAGLEKGLHELKMRLIMEARGVE